MIKGQSSAELSARRERTRRRIATLIIIFYLAVIFDGALRKWIFPGAHKILFFLRDPIVLYVYYLAIKEHFIPTRSREMIIGGLLGVAYLVWVVIQAATLGITPLVYVYGLKMHFMLLPLVFITKEVFDGRDIKRLLAITLILAIPMSILMVAQFHSPKTAFINRTFSEEANEKLPTIDKDHVRPSGTFTDGRFSPMFIGSSAAMMLSQWLLPPPLRVLSTPLLTASSIGVVACLAHNGNRQSFFYTGFCVIAAMFAVLNMKGKRAKTQGTVMLCTVVFASLVLMGTAFMSGTDATIRRQEDAENRQGSIVARALRMLTDVQKVVDETPWHGKGIGFGSGGGSTLATSKRQWTLAEDEWSRNVQEAGALGFLFVAYRIFLCIVTVQGAITAVRRSNNPLPLVMCGFSIPLFAVGLLTLVGVTNGYGFLFLAFNMAMNKLGTPSGPAQKKPASAPPPGLTAKPNPAPANPGS